MALQTNAENIIKRTRGHWGSSKENWKHLKSTKTTEITKMRKDSLENLTLKGRTGGSGGREYTEQVI